MIANIDTLVFTIDIDDYDNVCKPLLHILDDIKQIAKKNISEMNGEKSMIEIGNMTFEVKSVGVRMYAFILHNDMYEIQLAQHRSKSEYNYPVFIRIKSECLWSQGFLESVSFIKSWVAKNIGEIKTTKISRADLCCHTDSIRLRFDDIEKFKSRCREQNCFMHDRALSSLNFGSRATQKVYARIYDKSLEIQEKRHKTWFRDIWESKGLNPDKVWNIEFELNREFFTDYYIDTVDDFIDKIKTIWRYLTVEWLSLVDFNREIIDRKHIDRCTINKAWLSLRSAFDNFMGYALIKRVKQLSHDASAMVPQIIGCLSSFASKCSQVDLMGALSMIRFKGTQYLDSKDTTFKDEVMNKRSLLYSMGGSAC